MKKVLSFLKKLLFITGKLAFLLFAGFFVFSFLVKACQNKYNGPQYEADLYQMLDDYVVAYGKKHNAELIHVGDFTEPRKRLMFCVWLRSYAFEDLPQARIRAVTFVQDFYAMLKQNLLANAYLEQSKGFYLPEDTSEVRLKKIGVKIAYWDNNVNRPQPPYLAEITFLDEQFKYYEADLATQALRLVHEESYEDAIGNLRKSQF